MLGKLEEAVTFLAANVYTYSCLLVYPKVGKTRAHLVVAISSSWIRQTQDRKPKLNHNE